MATNNYSWNLPTVGGSEDAWGTQLNANWTALDTLLGGTNATEFAILDGATVTTAELNALDGFTGTVADLNYAKDLRATGVTALEFDKLDGLTATTLELNVLDGITSTTAELNKLDGFTGTVADLNYAKDLRATGVTAAEFDKLDGVTWTLTDYNALTATATELNILDGVTGKTGADTTLVTGTAGTSGQYAQWNADGDVVGVTLPTLPEADWEAGTSTTEAIVSPAKNKAAFDAFEQQVGVGQTWQNVTSTRSRGVSYQNETGRPITVMIESSNENLVQVSTDNSVWVDLVDRLGQVNSFRGYVTFIVPPSHYYRLTTGSGTFNSWAELR